MNDSPGGGLPAPPSDRTLRYLRRQIPAFACVAGCHDCCGPVTASPEEMARLPVRSVAQRGAALAELCCPHLGVGGCTVYAERPLICRLFGTTPRHPCPNGCAPDLMTAPLIERRIERYLQQRRQVLV